MKKVLLGVMLLVFCGLSMEAAERMTVAWLPPRNASGDTNTAHWQYAIELLTHAQLFEVKSIRLLPQGSIDYAFRQLKLKDDEALNPEQARALGKTIEAKRVVWTEYEQEDKKYSLTLQVVTVASGDVSKKLTCSGPDWFQVVSNSVNSALRELAVVPTPDEKNRMNHPPTHSAEALELWARGATVRWESKSLSESEPLFRKAALMDPAFSTPLMCLAENMVFDHDRMTEAETLARQAVTIRPNYPYTHQALGIIYEFEGTNQLARDELLEAVRLYPDDPESYERLGEIYSRMNKFKDAILALKQAARLAPYSPEPHAYLAIAYSTQGNRDQALAELKTSEHLYAGDVPEVDQLLADAYLTLKDVPHYVEYAEKFLAATKQMDSQSQQIKDAEKELAYWKERLSPHFVTASVPHTYSHEELDEALKAKLTPSECRIAKNPLTCTPRMKQWAEELTAGATGDEQKAKRLFEELLHHIDSGSSGGIRTAEQTFDDWKEPNSYFTCQEYALLYVTLAREVGLKAWVTLIDKDYEASRVEHACAGVFIGNQVLLVDPTYEWFGAPHHEYELQDDFQMIGAYLCQLPKLQSRRVAVKLRPEFAMAHFNYAMNLTDLYRLKEARKELAAGLTIDPDSPLALITQGAIEASEQKWAVSAEHLRQGLDLVRGFDEARYELAMVLYNQGKLLEARDQFQKYLEGQTEPRRIAFALKTINRINKSLAKMKSPPPPQSQPVQEIMR
ncbi:MAG: Tetratricopeptide 2 repeat protein [Pedosphaera sp.]|nr:Tetratricopeptide 2 repeat protein [Pedosphaera sp.]